VPRARTERKNSASQICGVGPAPYTQRPDESPNEVGRGNGKVPAVRKGCGPTYDLGVEGDRFCILFGKSSGKDQYRFDKYEVRRGWRGRWMQDG